MIQTEREKIWERNNLIDRFYYGEQIGHLYEGMNEYNKKWELLMPVVEKIDQVWNDEDIDVKLLEEDHIASRISHLRIWAGIETIWDAVISFIEWYNEYKLSVA